MENEKRLIDANALKRIIQETIAESDFELFKQVMRKMCDILDKSPTVDALVLPCKIGQRVWAIRNFKGVKHAESGIVSDMLFTQQMKLQIVVKYVARGEWGKVVFATREEAEAALAKMDRKDDT